jgi:hypothetical protein
LIPYQDLLQLQLKLMLFLLQPVSLLDASSLFKSKLAVQGQGGHA